MKIAAKRLSSHIYEDGLDRNENRFVFFPTPRQPMNPVPKSSNVLFNGTGEGGFAVYAELRK
jgi:hypothetical protein